MYTYYVYAYINKKTGLPYYIGKGKDYRAYAPHGRIKVPKDRTKIVFLETNLSDIGACALERRYIRWYGRKNDNSGILLNLTEGGDGTAGFKYGPLSEERKDKLRGPRKPYGPQKNPRKKGYKVPNRKPRPPFSAEHLEKLKKAKIGAFCAYQKGKHWYNNGTISKFFFENEVPDGWVKGRI